MVIPAYISLDGEASFRGKAPCGRPVVRLWASSSAYCTQGSSVSLPRVGIQDRHCADRNLTWVTLRASGAKRGSGLEVYILLRLKLRTNRSPVAPVPSWAEGRSVRGFIVS
jgi:hypothetical protein